MNESICSSNLCLFKLLDMEIQASEEMFPYNSARLDSVFLISALKPQ